MMAIGVPTVSPTLRRSLSALLATLLLLMAAGPAFGYNEENVKHIRITRLDPVDCGTPIRLVADLRDKRGSAVPGATVNWSFKKQEAGDSLAPTTTASDAEGRARTEVTLSCEKGNRIVRAAVPGDGAAIITIQFNPNKAAAVAAPPRQAGNGSAGGGTQPEPAAQPDASSATLADAAAPLTGIVLATLVLIIAVGLLARLATRRTRPFGSTTA